MKKIITPLIMLASCTPHQTDRVVEALSPASKREDLRTLHYVLDGLHHRPGFFDLSIKKLSPLETTRGSFSLHALETRGLPYEERFILASIDPLKNRVIPLAEFTLLQNDVLLIHEKQGDSVKDRLSIVLNSLLKGQAVQLALISKTGTNCTTVEFIPDPIETILGDAEFRLVTAHRKGTHFLLQGKGLKPNERISIQEQSGSLVHKHTILADEQGRLSAPIEPIVLGKLGGSASLILTREDHESRIDYAWGSKLEVESSQHSLFHPVIFSPKNPLQENGLSFIESEELAKKLHF